MTSVKCTKQQICIMVYVKAIARIAKEITLNFNEFVEVKQAQQKPKEDYPRGFKPGLSGTAIKDR